MERSKLEESCEGEALMRDSWKKGGRRFPLCLLALKIDMKRVITTLLAGIISLSLPAQLPISSVTPFTPRERVSVLITNDLSGDVDGIFALVHQLLSTLTATFEPGAASSFYEKARAPYITDEGLYDFGKAGREITIYNTIDTRLMSGDMESWIRNFAAAEK